MMDQIKRTWRRATALILVVALLLPATALAVGNGEGQAAGDATRVTDRKKTAVEEPTDPVLAQARLNEQRREQVRERVRERLRIRKARFDKAVEILLARIDRVENVAARVEAAGGDVDDVYALLRDARDKIEDAKELEAESVRLFLSIPDSADPRATFIEARDKAIEAVQALKDARAKVRQAIEALLAAIDALGSDA